MAMGQKLSNSGIRAWVQMHLVAQPQLASSTLQSLLVLVGVVCLLLSLSYRAWRMQNPSSPNSLTFQCSLGFQPISWTFLLYPVPTVGESSVRHSACCSLCAKFHFYDSIWSLSPNPTILVMIPIPIFCPDLPCSSRLYVQIHLKCLVVVVVVVFSLNVPQNGKFPISVIF